MKFQAKLTIDFEVIYQGGYYTLKKATRALMLFLQYDRVKDQLDKEEKEGKGYLRLLRQTFSFRINGVEINNIKKLD